MKSETIKAIFTTGLVVFIVGVVGEVIYYGIEFEMLVIAGLTTMAVVGGLTIWGEGKIKEGRN